MIQDDNICPSCSGSGEGMSDGSTCHQCRGSGSVPVDDLEARLEARGYRLDELDYDNPHTQWERELT